MFGSFPPSPLVVSASKVYSGLGADIVYGIITLKTLGGTTADHYVRETPEDTKHGMAMLERELSGLETTDSEWNLLKAGD